jgi:hypothetical protein
MNYCMSHLFRFFYQKKEDIVRIVGRGVHWRVEVAQKFPQNAVHPVPKTVHFRPYEQYPGFFTVFSEPCMNRPNE